MCGWAPAALLPVFQILGTEYRKKVITTKFLDEAANMDAFTKIDFTYDDAVASIKVAKAAKSEGELIVTGTKGYIYVPAPWWKTDYFEVRYENPEDNQRFFYQLDGEGIRYEIVAFAKSVEVKKPMNYVEKGVSKSIAKIIESFNDRTDIRFIAINDNYDNANTESSDSDSIVVPFKNLLNDSYCRDISIKVRSQLDMKRRKGEFIGGYAIYGYCKDKRNKNRLVVDEYAADIVRSIYRRKLEGMSAQAIAEQLNSENVLAPSEYKRLCGLNYHSGFKAGTHAKWQAIQVLRILKNEIYTGTMVQGRRQKINYKIKKIRDVEESGWIRVPNMHEAIIPQKLFDTVQEVLKLDTCASKGQQTVNLFSGIVRCGGCGQNMVRRTVSKNGKKYIYLHCVTNHNGLGCSSHLISESKLAEVVLAALQGKVQQISGLEHRLDEINEIPKNERRLKSVEEHLKMLEQEEQKYQTLRRQLYEDMSGGIVSKEEYKEFSHSFNEKVETIRKAKAEMNRQRDCLNNLDVEHLPWIEDFKSYQNLTSLNRRVLVELVESITVYDKEHIHIQYRFDQEIRNVLEYCSSVPAAETEESAV